MDYFAVFCHEYDYTNHLFRKSGGWRLATHSFFFIKYFLMGLLQFGLRHFNLNLNENLHQRLSF